MLYGELTPYCVENHHHQYKESALAPPKKQSQLYKEPAYICTQKTALQLYNEPWPLRTKNLHTAVQKLAPCCTKNSSCYTKDQPHLHKEAAPSRTKIKHSSVIRTSPKLYKETGSCSTKNHPMQYIEPT
jgi:hypothetical protein